MMQNIDNFGVQELNAQEIKEIEGGIMIGLCICLFALGMAIGLGTMRGSKV
jgi:hypothetical protein